MDVLSFCINLLSALSAYSFFDKKPAINVDYLIKGFVGLLTRFKYNSRHTDIVDCCRR